MSAVDEAALNAARRIWSAARASVADAAAAVREARGASAAIPAEVQARLLRAGEAVARESADLPADLGVVERRMAAAMRWADALDAADRALDSRARAVLGPRWADARRAMRGLPWTEAPFIVRGRREQDGERERFGFLLMALLVLIALAGRR